LEKHNYSKCCALSTDNLECSYSDCAVTLMTEELWFNFHQGQQIILYYEVQTGSDAHSASC